MTSPYVGYVQRCRAIAHEVGTDLRRLDRALWCWHRYRSDPAPAAPTAG